MNRPRRGRAFRSITAATALFASTAPVLAQYSAITGDVTVTPQPGSFYTTDQLVHPENKYIPNVVWRENGAASLEALKVQAVAARGYLYYKLSQTPNGGKATSIRDGTADQVYSKATAGAPLTRATATSTQLKYFDVTDATEREILIVNTSATSTPRWEPVCTFYVAGGKPDTAAQSTWWPNGALLGQWETGDQLPTDTEKWVTYQRGNTAWTPTPLGSLSNPVNRGAMSQNGADFLSDGRVAPVGATYGSFAGWNYVDILKCYYGQSAQLMMAKVPTSGELPINQKVLASFDLDEGYLRNAMNASATTSNVDFATSSHVRDTAVRHGTTGASQRITINIPTAPTGAFTYRHMSGMVMGTEANPNLNDALIGTTVSNIIIENRGSIGFWLRTTTPNLKVRPLLDEGATATEQGLQRNVVADGLWHKYEWFVTDNPEWSSFSGGNNAIAGQWTLDSLLFTGDGNSTLHLDTLFYDARTTVPLNQWVYDANGSYNFAGNWVSGTPNGVGQTARLWSLTSARRAVNVDTAVTVGTLDFNHASGYDLNGAGLVTLDVASGNAAINAAAGQHTINANLKLNDNTVFTSPSGNTTFNGNIDGATKSLTINTVGTATISGGQLASLTIAGGNVIQKAGATMSVAGDVTIETVRQLNVNGTVNAGRVQGNGYVNVQGTFNLAPNGTDAGTSQLRGISLIGAAGKFNAADNDLVFEHGSPAPDVIEAQYRQWVLAARGGAASGIFYTRTPADDTILAFGKVSELAITDFNGIAVGGTTIVGKYTYYGDANFDGQVTTDDYVAVDLGLGTGDSWVQGDFDLNGVVSTDDYVVVDLNLGKGTTNPLAFADEQATMIALHSEMFGQSYLDKLAYASEFGWVAASVPEPGAMSLVALTVIPMLRRRRRAD